MWYIIQNAYKEYSIRYYSGKNAINPEYMFTAFPGYGIWASNIAQLTYKIHDTKNFKIYHLPELIKRNEMKVIPIPDVPMDIASVDDIASLYPELLI